MSDFLLFDGFADAPTGAFDSAFGNNLFQPRNTELPGRSRPQTGRHFMDRLLAPLGASAQGIYSFITEVDDDGFQWTDFSKAMGHSFRYANPWSDVRRIEESEVRRAMFGSKSDDWHWLARTATGIGISLLFDPVTYIPPAALAKVTKADDVLRLAAKASKGFRDRIGKSSAGMAVMQGLFNRNYGLPEKFLNEVDTFRQNTNALRFEANSILKAAEGLGKDKTVMNLMSEALESEAVYLMRQGASSGKKIAATNIKKRLAKAGVNETLFWDIYDRVRALDDSIGEGLMKSGVISENAFEAMRGKHLRRVYASFENPAEHLKRLEVISSEGGVRLSAKRLTTELNKLSRSLPLNLSPQTQGASSLLGSIDPAVAARRRYFQPNGRFNTKNIVDDLETYLSSNPKASIAEAMDFVNTTMLKDSKLTPGTQKAFINHISQNSVDMKKTADEVIDIINARLHSPDIQWRTLVERTSVISERKNLPPAIKEALGEITEFAPRIVAEVTDVGKLLSTRKFFDRLAGITRSPTGEIVEKLGTDIVSKTRSSINSMRIAGKYFGDLDGMYTTRAVHNYLNRMEGMGSGATDPARRIAEAVLGGIESVNRFFKLNKVVFDPTAQLRNAFSDLIMMDATGVNIFKPDSFIKSARELQNFNRTGNLGNYLQLSELGGLDLFQSVQSSVELRRAAGALTEPTVKTVSDGAGFMKRIFQSLRTTQENLAEPFLKAMEFREMQFKLNGFIQHYDELAGNFVRSGGKLNDSMRKNIAQQATKLAEKGMFNYNELPFIWDFARKYGVIPFVSFPVKAIPSVFDVAVNRPHKLLKYPRYVDVTSKELMGASPLEVAKEIAALPDYARDGMVIKLPFNDDNDRPLYADISYLLPWFVLQDVKESSSLFTFGEIDRSSMAVSPLLGEIVSFVTNTDSFGREITKPGMTAVDKASIWSRRLWEFLMPSLSPGGTRTRSIGKTLLSHATNDPQRTNWEKVVTRGMGIYSGTLFTPFDSDSANVRQVQAQTLIDASERPVEAAIGGTMGLFTTIVASDPQQQLRISDFKFSQDRAEIQREINSIRRNTQMSVTEKKARIERLRQLDAEIRAEFSARTSAIRGQ